MTDPVPTATREIDLPRVIVWGALVDPVLVEGWLHPEYRLIDGTSILHLEEPIGLEIESDELGHLLFDLEEMPGGTRGTRTRLTVAVLRTIDDRFSPTILASWRVRLDQLERLLRGHPVDWDHWERDHGADYRAYLARAGAHPVL